MRVRRFHFDRLAVLVAVACGFAAAAARADTVVLANGDRLTGQVLLMDAGTLVLKTEYAGDVHIAWDQVAKLETQDPLALRAEGLPIDYQARLVASGSEGKVVPIAPGELPAQVGVPAGAEDVTAPVREIGLTDIRRIVRPHPFLQDWLLTGNLDVALDATNASSRNQSWSAAANVSARRGLWRHGLRLHYLRKTQDKVVGTNNYGAAYTVDRFFSPKLFMQGRVRFERDHIVDPSEQRIFGLGPGYQFWDDELGSLSMSALVTRTRFMYQDGDDEHFQSLGLSWNYQRYFGGRSWQLFSNGEVYRGLRSGKYYDLNAELGLRYSMTQWMSLYSKASYSSVASGHQGTSREIRYSLGVGVTW
ncbi:DUF481 domain-containing protein [Pusillimonas sp. CC-YST705]|uniref:DUF481 domain-containing protein n=1 Tax=Mesopusillimonas faecipullorum TaxID=2755040 RepID=A0ABS8C8S8_9BURK|nr:DUF481 domain-containing protein [Mesopusillimonas faecipullorum]MCB5362254.1 DUF481 domain-containing protein [Mesopusillimonas faecipullorum]